MSYSDEQHEQEARDREIREKIDRLRKRARDAAPIGDLRGVLLGILDLLGDEL